MGGKCAWQSSLLFVVLFWIMDSFREGLRHLHYSGQRFRNSLLSLGLRGNSKMQFPCVLGGMLFFCLRKKNGAMTPLWSFTFALWLCLFLVSSWQEQFLTFRLQCMFWWGVQIHVYFPRKPQACQAAAGGHAVVPDCVALWILSGLNCTVNADLPEWVLEAIHRLQRVC